MEEKRKNTRATTAPALPVGELLTGTEGWYRLEPDILVYLKGRRWFRGKARLPRAASVVEVIAFPGDDIIAVMLLVESSFLAGRPDTYALPVVIAPESGRPDLQIQDSDVIATFRPEGAEPVIIYDAMSDPVFCGNLLRMTGQASVLKGRHGSIRTAPTAVYSDILEGPETDLRPVPVLSEQSNTSVMFGRQVILKLFRCLEPGINPDVEIGRFLTEETQFTGISRVTGTIDYRRGRGKPVSLAVIHEYVPNEGEAWQYTLNSLEQFFERVLPAGNVPDEETVSLVVNPYREAAVQLGKRTAELHLALASGRDGSEFTGVPFSPDYRESLYRGMRKLAMGSLVLLEERLAELPESIREAAASVLSKRKAIYDHHRRLRQRDMSTGRIRCHGDYHLGQVLFTGNDFVIIDFEGEPIRSLAERRAKASPLKDVAGMVRSFHYALHTVLNRRLLHCSGEETTRTRRMASAWYSRISTAFIDTYRDTMRGSGLLPEDDPDFNLLLDAFLLDKALYELSYELNYRPDWVGVPLRGILDLLAEEGPVERKKMKKTKQSAVTAAETTAVRYDSTRLSDDDLYLFNEGTHHRLYEKLGAHPMTAGDTAGTYFAVWAPNARKVSVIGDFNGWQASAHPLRPRSTSGIWEGFIPGPGTGTLYKYHIESHHQGYAVNKADPFAFYSEVPPLTASVIRDLDYEWEDSDWMEHRHERNSIRAAVSIYEMHPGSWQRVPEEGHRYLSYRELAPRLTNYIKETGFTHVEFLPLMEHPFYGSWGYQTTGYFSPTSRYGTPQDLMYLIDYLHREGIGVILDWVPSHFPNDEHGLAFFDGTHLFEHEDPRQRVHPDWDSYIFNYSRNEVRSFILSSAMFWLDKYHADGLRVDAVASILYLDYGRKKGEWIPNRFGGRENLEAISFLKQLNESAYGAHPDIQVIAEESTAWPMVSRPTYLGGLGFGLKWDMGWMHDTLVYMSKDPVYRKYHHNNLTFRMLYAFFENFVLPLSHDEVVHGKGSLLGKMPGDDWQKMANLRLLFGYMFAQPGKKLLFMGGEFGQWREWNHEESLDWHLLQYEPHDGLKRWVRDLNGLYRSRPALYERDNDQSGFRWIDCSDVERSVVSLARRGEAPGDLLVAVCNFTPETQFDYRIGMPLPGTWKEVLNSDAAQYYGSGKINGDLLVAEDIAWHGEMQSVSLTLPPLGISFLVPWE